MHRQSGLARGHRRRHLSRSRKASSTESHPDGPTAPAKPGESSPGPRTAGRRRFLPRDAGARAEALVAAHLQAAGLQILAVNLHVGRLELDVVARDGAVIVVVEVRARGPGAWVRPLDSIDARKRERVRRAGERLWQERFANDASIERMRFDAAAVDTSAEGDVRIEIVRAAF